MKLDKHFINHLTTARNIGVMTGAGISADSGIATFRGKDGLWNNIPVEKVATLEGFLENPELVWKFYDMRRIEISKAKPNHAHLTLKELEDFYQVSIITQNIDGFHKLAGSSNIIELHGNIWEVRCMETGKVSNNTEAPLTTIPPKSETGSLLRPNVIWFGEALPQKALDLSLKIASESDIFIVIGTSAAVQPAASIPMIAKRANAFLVEINIEETQITRFTDLFLKGKAVKVLPELIKEIKKIKGK
ncbi:MAG TPA: NAD-dependent deacylase [Firmicutes bacterium]|nr:NAD-dependent deacylase [Bacillota bacterium]